MELSYEAVCFDLFGTLVTGDGAAIDGVREVLALLPAGRWAVVTSCGARFALALLAAAGLPPPSILVSADDVTHGKPSPDPYRLGAERLGRDPKNVLAVEDSRDGIASGRAAGMDVIAIARGRGAAFARDAVVHVDRFAEIRWSVADDGLIRVVV